MTSRFVTLAAAIAMACLTTQFVSAKDSTPQPPYPADAQKSNEHGTIKLAIVFAADGSVKSVKVTNPTSKNQELEEGTRAFIKENWKAPSFAGTTQHTQIEFSGPAVGSTVQAAGASNTPPVPYPQEARENYEQGDVKFAVTFGPDGKATAVKILNSSMKRIHLERETRSFILDEWKAPAFANTTQTTTMSFGTSGVSADTSSPVAGGGSGSGSSTPGGGHVAH